MTAPTETPPPEGTEDERELLLRFLDYLRRSVLRKVSDLDDTQARWRPDSALLPLIGIVNHLAHVEWRWTEGGLLGGAFHRSEEEFFPGPELDLATAIARYRQRAAETDRTVRALASLNHPCHIGEGRDLRWVLLHLIEETARHAGHADATSELLDGATGR